MRIFLVLIATIFSFNTFSQGFFNVSYVGNVVRFNDETSFDIPIGLHVAYKQNDNIGFYTSFKMSSPAYTGDKYLNFNAYQTGDTEKGVAFDYTLFNIGINDYVYDNIGLYLGIGLASITEYKHYSTNQPSLGTGGEYFLPRDKMIREFNLNIGVFYKFLDIAVAHFEFDTAIGGISLGVGVSLPDVLGISFKKLYDSDEIYKPAEEEVLEE
jgi:hypothetical protein